MTTKKILVIEDEEGLREIIQFSLEAVAGWDVIGAASGSEGIAIAQTEQPDAILLDVMMPDMDGIATFEHLQANPLTEHIPTIFVTAKARNSEQQQFIDLGIAGLITKPIKAQDLVEQIQGILNWQG
ncbi:MAG: response regulator [Acaryochloris sp. RU_4_1]|nr:response regulator [Leptolyngbyaceae cyanobacterium SU_3_3]NJM64168.1 response regulator [Acaryochloris sp. RU_4_1]NJR53270.1 response regulator [Acaryochloris sp. CRU_2_0]